MMAVPFWLLGALCIGLTVLPLVPFRHWSVRIWDFPRQQIVILGTAALIGLLALRGLGGPIERGFILALCAALAYQLRSIPALYAALAGAGDPGRGASRSAHLQAGRRQRPDGQPAR